MANVDPRATAWMTEHLRNGCTVREAATWVTMAEAEHPKHSRAWWARIEELTDAFTETDR